MENLAGGSSAPAQAETKDDSYFLVRQLRKEAAEREAQAAEREAGLRKEAAERDAQAAEREAGLRKEAAERDARAAEREAGLRKEAAERDVQAAEREAGLRKEAAERDAQAAEREAGLRKEAAERDAQAAEREAGLRKVAAERDAQTAEREAGLRKVAAEYKAQAAEREAAWQLSPTESPSVSTYASAGSAALSELATEGRIVQAEPPREGASAEELAPLASPADLATFRACIKEYELVAAITPLLRAARGFPGADAGVDPCAQLLVNSEKVSWLDSLERTLPPDQRKRPDLFATWAPFWSGRLTANGATGKLAARALQLDGCACEFYEAKLGVGELSNADFGQLVDYHSRVRGTVRGMLFNAHHFWLLESNRDQPVALTKGLLGAPGSRALIRRFFDAGTEPPLLPLLRSLFQELHVLPRKTAVSAGSQDSSYFLGAGGSARVFSVTAADGEPCALKASLLLSRAELHFEFETMQRAAVAGAPVVPTVPDSLMLLNDASSGEFCGGGFLLRGVCRRAVLSSAALLAEAFAALHELHAAGFVHGDARLPNLLHSEAAGGKMLWVDLRAGSLQRDSGLVAAQRSDALTLATSALGVEQGGRLPEAVLAALADVPSDPGAYARVADTLRAVKGYPA